MKTILSLCLLVLVFTGQAFAWGQTGHRAVGLVAGQHLNKKTRKAVLRVLQDNSLAEVSKLKAARLLLITNSHIENVSFV